MWIDLYQSKESKPGSGPGLSHLGPFSDLKVEIDYMILYL